jgi:hypothetical protein
MVDERGHVVAAHGLSLVPAPVRHRTPLECTSTASGCLWTV